MNQPLSHQNPLLKLWPIGCNKPISPTICALAIQPIGTSERPSFTRFLITPPLYFMRFALVKKKQNFFLKERMRGGNPLLFLFDKLETKNEKEYQVGDILYLAGVESCPAN